MDIERIRKFIKAVDYDKISVYSSSIAFYCFLSAFPAITAVISIYLMLTPDLPDTEVFEASSVIPQEVTAMVFGQSEKIMRSRALSLAGASISILIGLWMANMAVRSLIKGLNLAFSLKGRRSVLVFNFYSLGLTTIFISMGVISLLMISLPHVILTFIPSGYSYNSLLVFLNYLIFGLLLIGGLTLTYKYVPGHKVKRKISLYIPGALLATFFTIFISLGFSLYINNFANFNRIYGAFSSIVIFMFWLQFCASSILLGARLNSFLFQKIDKA